MGFSVQILTDEISNSYRLARPCLGAAEQSLSDHDWNQESSSRSRAITRAVGVSS